MNWSRYQQVIFESVAYTSDSLLVEAVAGCLTGDTLVGLNRAGRSFKLPLQDVVHRFNGGLAGTKLWQPDISTYIRAPHPDGTVRLAQVTAAMESGPQDVSVIRLKSGKALKATLCHRFMTPDGWKRLDELGSSALVIVEANGKGPGQGRTAKRNYLKRCVPFHPHAVNSGSGKLSVPTHRLHVEAKLNGMDLEEFVWFLQRDAKGLRFLDSGLEVHHKDGNHWNNGLSNLEVMTVSEHKLLHSDDNLNNMQTHLIEDEVLRVASVGREMTYDLTVPKADSFIANGIAVHNSGKTTTIVEAIKHVPRDKSVLFCAFNKTISETLKSRISSPNATCATLHSLGLRAWQSFCGGGVKVENRKSWDLLKSLSWADRRQYSALPKLVGLAKQVGMVPDGVQRLRGEFFRQSEPSPLAQPHQSLLGPSQARQLASVALDQLPDTTTDCAVQGLVLDTDAMWQELMETYDIDSKEVSLPLARQMLRDSLLKGPQVVDYDDMLWLPIVTQAPFNQYDVVFCDEIQDLSGIQHEMVARMLGPKSRFIGVGDSGQAIYHFRGATADSMALARDRFHCRSLPLSISYRCPQAVVRHAQQWVSRIEAAPEAPGGTVLVANSWGLSQFRQSDVVLCRLTRPLVALAFKLIRARIPCRVLGRDIGQGLVKLIDRSKLLDYATGAQMLNWLDEHERRETESLKRKQEWGKIGLLQDRLNTLRLFADDAMTIGDMRREIEELFKDNGSGLVLSTIHKFKGQEALRVFVLDADQWMPPPWATDLEQERNLAYVACTRAQQELYYIQSKGLYD